VTPPSAALRMKGQRVTPFDAAVFVGVAQDDGAKAYFQTVP
jgi:hypothetical protein